MGPTPTLTRTSSPTSMRGSSRGNRRVRRLPYSACHEPDTHDDPRRLVRRALVLATKSIRDARVYTYTCTVHDKILCTRLQNYAIGTSLKSVSVSVSVQWNSSYTGCMPNWSFAWPTVSEQSARQTKHRNTQVPGVPKAEQKLPCLSKIWMRWLSVSATTMSSFMPRQKPCGELNWPRPVPGSPIWHLQYQYSSTYHTDCHVCNPLPENWITKMCYV